MILTTHSSWNLLFIIIQSSVCWEVIIFPLCWKPSLGWPSQNKQICLFCWLSCSRFLRYIVEPVLTVTSVQRVLEMNPSGGSFWLSASCFMILRTQSWLKTNWAGQSSSLIHAINCIPSDDRMKTSFYSHWLRLSQDCSSHSVQTLNVSFKLGTVLISERHVAGVTGEVGVEGDVVGEGGEVALGGGRMVEEVHKLRLEGWCGGGGGGGAARRGWVGVAGLLLQIEPVTVVTSSSVWGRLVLVLVLRSVGSREHVSMTSTVTTAPVTWTSVVWSLGLEVELDCHLVMVSCCCWGWMLLLLLLLLRMFLVSQSALVLRLSSEWSLFNGDHWRCVGVDEAGQSVAGGGWGGGVRVFRGGWDPRSWWSSSWLVVVDGVSDELCVELLDCSHCCGHVSEGWVLWLILRTAVSRTGLTLLTWLLTCLVTSSWWVVGLVGSRQTVTRCLSNMSHVGLLSTILLSQYYDQNQTIFTSHHHSPVKSDHKMRTEHQRSCHQSQIAKTLK